MGHGQVFFPLFLLLGEAEKTKEGRALLTASGAKAVATNRCCVGLKALIQSSYRRPLQMAPPYTQRGGPNRCTAGGANKAS